MELIRLTKNELNQVAIWFDAPHVAEWFDRQEWINEIENSIDSTWVKYFILKDNNQLVGFAQYYFTDQAPLGQWSNQPIKTVGIDYFIGEKNYLGKGFSEILIDKLIEKIKKETDAYKIVADPDKDNKRSISVLEKIGFKIESKSGLFILEIKKPQQNAPVDAQTLSGKAR